MRFPLFALCAIPLLASAGCDRHSNDPDGSLSAELAGGPGGLVATPAPMPGYDDPGATRIVAGPAQLGTWTTDVSFRWSRDQYPQDDRYYAITSTADFQRDRGEFPASVSVMAAWMDTLTYYPDFSGGYFTDSLVWRIADEDSIRFTAEVTVAPDLLAFGVRAQSHGEREHLQSVRNFRMFRASTTINGPTLHVASDLAGVWNSGEFPPPHEIFAGNGLRFRWTAEPGPTDAPVAGFAYAVDDTSMWSAYSAAQQWPPEGDPAWLPAPGPHTLFVRAIDEAGAVTVVAAALVVYAGPQSCADPGVLVVLDTSPSWLQAESIWPDDYAAVERQLAEQWFDGYDIQIFETNGVTPPPVSMLDCASTVVWLHSASLLSGDPSVLRNYHTTHPNPLPSYVASGGNVMLCGLWPSRAMAYVQSVDGSVGAMGNPPFDFGATLGDADVVSHWLAGIVGVDLVAQSHGNTYPPSQAGNRLALCRSQITGGPNAYPDLAFDPATWPDGATQAGFGYYDRGVKPLAAAGTEVIYTANDSSDAIAVRHLTSPGTNGNVVYLGFHPYFLDRTAFTMFAQAALADFGETPTP